MFKWSWIIWIQTLNQPAERLFRERLSCSDRLFSSIIHPLFVRLCFSLARFSPVVSVHPSFLCVEAAAGGITRPTGRTGEHGRLSALIGPFSFYSSGFSPSSPLSLCPLSSLTHTLTHSHTHTHTHTHTPGSIGRYHSGAVDKPGCHGNTAWQPRQRHHGNWENSPPTTPPTFFLSSLCFTPSFLFFLPSTFPCLFPPSCFLLVLSFLPSLEASTYRNASGLKVWSLLLIRRKH